MGFFTSNVESQRSVVDSFLVRITSVTILDRCPGQLLFTITILLFQLPSSFICFPSSVWRIRVYRAVGALLPQSAISADGNGADKERTCSIRHRLCLYLAISLFDISHHWNRFISLGVRSGGNSGKRSNEKGKVSISSGDIPALFKRSAYTCYIKMRRTHI